MITKEEIISVFKKPYFSWLNAGLFKNKTFQIHMINNPKIQIVNQYLSLYP
jgi:hypothetical protein